MMYTGGPAKSRSKKRNRDLAGLSVFQYYLVTLSRGLLNKN